MTSEKIFIVEDEAIVVESLNDHLESLGYTISGQASSGEQALLKISKNESDLVLMDIMLKGEMDGVETAKQVSSLYGIPVVFLTAYSDSETLKRAKLVEPYGYLIKPYKVRELHTTLEITLYKHRMEKRMKVNERRLGTILRSIGDGVITADKDGIITSMNPVAEFLTGWTESESKQKKLIDVIKLESNVNTSFLHDLFNQALNDGRVSCVLNKDLIMLSKKGNKTFIDLSADPIQIEDNHSSGVVFTIRDISSQKKAETDLFEARHLLQNSLTPREKEILQLMVAGSTTKEIAFDLNISNRTVEAHRQHMMTKLNATDMTMLVRLAITHKLVPI